MAKIEDVWFTGKVMGNKRRIRVDVYNAIDGNKQMVLPTTVMAESPVKAGLDAAVKFKLRSPPGSDKTKQRVMKAYGVRLR